MNRFRVYALCLLTLCLAACEDIVPASTAGECRIFEQPKHVIRGKTRKDQRWIDTTIERGIAGCNWQRPEISGQ
jgi:hypothetical protein